ncbi:MAG: N-acetyltransferase [Comamonadaceae bacterium]|nr:MAG: N-acetyltransferase [Comamonadaceae bacterium]
MPYPIRVLPSIGEVPAAQWNKLLAAQGSMGPFMRHEYLDALTASGSAVPETGWSPCVVTLWTHDSPDADLVAACPVYLKAHSYGEYVFDWAWANAYQEHGLAYYPKALVAVPFTPVPGSRLLARDPNARAALVRALIAFCEAQELSSLHLLFAEPADVTACEAAGLMLRHTVQFHWSNRAVASPGALQPASFTSFDGFLAELSQDKRKKIRQERRKVTEAGVTFRWARGRDITPADWEFFYRCYARTYREHGNAPYLTRDFFRRVSGALPQAWLMFVAERAGCPIAASLIALDLEPAEPDGSGATRNGNGLSMAAYGRYWGAIERVDCLHFEACYYQPIEWCIEHGFGRFEGGAQGEHKMARALMPVKTTSAHWLAHPAFADAVQRFLEREGSGIDGYMDHLDERSPFRQTG